jgi:hypothetical protein
MLRFLYSNWLDKGRNETIGTGPLNNYEDQRSNAPTDIDITHRTGPSGQSFYMVSLFARPH